MIIEFKVANYRSIGAEQTLSFVADRATRHPGNLIKRPGYRLLKAVGLFGANASGKSNLVKALGAMSAFVRDSATKMNSGDPILAAEPYRLDPEMSNGPSRFAITFVTDGTVYAYGFAADTQRVHEEWLTAKTEGNGKTLFNFVRNTNEQGALRMSEGMNFGNATLHLIEQRTRANALYLSVADRDNVKELLPVYRYIREAIAVYDMTLHADMLRLMTAHDCLRNPGLNRQVEDLLRDADTDVTEVRPEYERLDNPATVTLPSGTISRQAPQLNITYTQTGSDGKPVEFDFRHHASTGTQRLYGLAGRLLKTFNMGSFIAIDELDASMHPLLTRKLLELFQSPQANPKGAQLLFTTHDAVLLDTVLFRRDQIVLAEKCQGASAFFSLADIEPPIRNTESFLRNYLAGRYGGTPLFGRAFEDIGAGGEA